MPDTGFMLTIDELRQQMAVQLYGTDDYLKVSQLEQDNLKRWMKNGLRRFYYPMQGGQVYDWSFLKAEFTLKVDVNCSDYVMPPTFGGVIGDLVHVPGDNVRLNVVKVTPDRILELRQFNLTVTNYPFYYAERSIPRGGVRAQTWEIMVWPSPSGSYTFKGTQRINPLAVNDSHPYLYGGPEHAQTIIEACLAQAEIQMDGAPGVHAQEFVNCLQSSMAMDQSMHVPESLGYNGDGSLAGTQSAIMRDGMHFENFNDVTVGGVRYSG